MSILSRRQKNILLSDVQRMINNNNHTAFANQAKIAECVSNGDLKFYIDSPKKEFVIKYGNKEIRFNCNEQQIKELRDHVYEAMRWRAGQDNNFEYIKYVKKED